MIPSEDRARRGLRCGIIPLLLLALLTASPGRAEDPAPMTNEDVVRMTASGQLPREIIEAINSAPAVAFDLDPEIIIELRRAKVDDSVIEAMKEASSPTEVERPSAEPEPMGTLLLAFEDDEKKDPTRSTIVLPARDEKDQPFSLAFFLLCVYPTHVPDLWQEHTRLSIGFPRHRLHLLHLDTSTGKRQGKEVILLDRPEGREIPLPAGSHDIVVGIAASAGELPLLPIIEDSETVTIEPGETTTLTIRLRTRTSVRRMSGTPFTCEIVGSNTTADGP